MSGIWTALQNNPEINNHQLAEIVIDKIVENKHQWLNCDWCESLTMSAIATDELILLKNALDIVNIEYLSNIENFRSQIDTLYDYIESYSISLDIYHFAELLLTVESDQDLLTYFMDVKSRLEAAIIDECYGAEHPHAHGLSIYFPDIKETSYNAICGNPTYGLDFAADAHWDELLEAYFSSAHAVERSYSTISVRRLERPSLSMHTTLWLPLSGM